VVSLLLLTACGGTTEPNTAKGGFMGGTLGIVGIFQNFGVLENGISSVYDTESFPIEVTLQNKGEYKIKPGDVTVRLMGPTKDFAGIPSLELKNKGEIETISDLLPAGGEETVTFAADAKYGKPVLGLLETEWYASIESKYQTLLVVPEVCLKEDLTDKRLCDPTGAKTFYVSGAPVTISSVEEDTAGQGIMAVRIKIKDMGSGLMTKVGEAFNQQQEKLTYAVDDNTWECKSGGKVNEARLIEGEAEILCKTKTALAKNTLGTQQLRLTFDYLYQDMISKKINVKQSVK
jgi:hypothetical protein